MGRFLRERAWLRGTLVVLVVLAALSPCLSSDFAWDDRRFIIDSPTIAEPGAVPGYFVRNMQQSYGAAGEAADGLDLYRPIPFALLALEYRLAGGARPALFHATSLLLHLLVVLLLWLLARRWLGEGGRPELCALLVGLHPVTGAAPLWVSAQTELLMAAALLGAVLLLDRPVDRPIAAALVFFVGLLSKEVLLLTLPAISVGLVLVRGVPWRRLAPIWTAAAAFFVLRVAVLGGVRAGHGSDLARALFQAPVLLLDGLRGLLLGRPTGLRHLGFEYAGMSADGAVLVVIAGGLLAVGLVAASWYLRRRAPLVALAVAVLLLMLAPVALVTTIPGWGGYGRYLYVPWLFTVLALVQVAGDRAWLPLAGGLLLLHLTALPQAISDWRGDEALGLSQVRNAPDLGVGYGWLGQADFVNLDYLAAAAHFERAVEVDPSYHPAFQNLAISRIRLGQAVAALQVLDRLEELHGRGPRSSFARGLALAQLGDSEGAARVAVEALRRAPADPDLLWLLDNLRAHHPDRERFEAWLDALLSASSPAAGPGSGSGTSAPAPRSTGSP